MTETTLRIRPPEVEELYRLGRRCNDDYRRLRARALLKGLDGKVLLDEEPRHPYRVSLSRDALALIRDEAPWLTRYWPSAFRDLPPPLGYISPHGVLSDNDVAERARGEVVEDVVVNRSGRGREATVAIKLEGGNVLRFTLPFGWGWEPRPARPSEIAMQWAEAARNG